ncbi:MAG TPA: hypothetical protein P5137_07860 [Candidatus Brocadiia bacterium]|nr:hypothetical protein [Candidatus Brocadiia bacterium]
MSMGTTPSTPPKASPCAAAWAPPGLLRLDYASRVDGLADWALVWPGDGADWVVQLHRHGSTGDQIFTRKDIRDLWLPHYRKLGLGVLSPNLHGNAWMSPAAAADLRELIAWTRRTYGARRFFFSSGSMGGTSNLIYAVLHPEDVAAVVARCPATDLAIYHDWLAAHPGGVRDQIRQAIATAYGGPPSAAPDVYAAHSALRNASRLTMPVHLCHADADPTIPVDESRRLAQAMAGKPNFTYLEIPGGHDAPLARREALDWLEAQVRGHAPE